MAGGKSTPKKDKKIKVSGGQFVKTGTILARGVSSYKAGKNVRGVNTLLAHCDGEISFTKKKTPKGSVKTFINILPKK
jgi:ribosomal protein L27